MKFGYARVSTKDQSLDLQMDALNKEGCNKIFTEVMSGAQGERKELTRLLETLREGDTLVIWKLDRLGRSLKHLVELVGQLMDRGVGLKSLNDPIDTTTSQGRLIFNIFASRAEFETDIIRERTMAGLNAAKARGRMGGRPKGSYNKMKAAAVVTLYKKATPISEITKSLQISRSTLYQYLRNEGVKYHKSQGNN